MTAMRNKTGIHFVQRTQTDKKVILMFAVKDAAFKMLIIRLKRLFSVYLFHLKDVF